MNMAALPSTPSAAVRPASPRDRLATAAFLAVACHLLLLLGIGFSSPAHDGTEATSLEVILVHDPVTDPHRNDRAAYLAEVNQRGAGTAEDVRRAQAPGGAAPTGSEGAASGGGYHPEGGGDDDLIATRALGAPPIATQAIAAGARSPIIVEPPRTEDTGLDTGEAFALRGNPHSELVVAANTRASGVAVYLDAWRHRIERIGTANYPLDIVRRAHLSGSPVLEVRIGSDGRLVDAIVSRSSGHLALDQAAINILRLAAPFEPFPAPIASQHDSLRLSYEWQFTDGEWKDSKVRVPENTP